MALIGQRSLGLALVAAATALALTTALAAAEGTPPGDRGQGGGVAASQGRPDQPGSQGIEHRSDSGAEHAQGPRAEDEGDNGPGSQGADEARECDTTTWETHGHYVSCVARGEVELGDDASDARHGELVSEAAQSEIGKDDASSSSGGAESNDERDHGRGRGPDHERS